MYSSIRTQNKYVLAGLCVCFLVYTHAHTRHTHTHTNTHTHTLSLKHTHSHTHSIAHAHNCTRTHSLDDTNTEHTCMHARMLAHVTFHTLAYRSCVRARMPAAGACVPSSVLHACVGMRTDIVEPEDTHIAVLEDTYSSTCGHTKLYVCSLSPSLTPTTPTPTHHPHPHLRILAIINTKRNNRKKQAPSSRLLEPYSPLPPKK